MQQRVATVAVIVVNWNTRDLLAECVASVAATTADLDVETVVVDNGSGDGSATMLRERFPQVRVIANDVNLGFARANNQAVEATDAPYLLMLNSDAVLCPGSLHRLLERMDSTPRAGLIGAQLREPSGAFQLSHVRFPSLGREALILSGLGRLLFGPWYPSFGPDSEAQPHAVEWVGGACMLVRRAAFEAVGGFDEGYFLYGEEMDLCYGLRQAGWEVWYEPAATVIHHGKASSAGMAEAREARLYRGRMRFFRKHYGPRAARFFAAELFVLTPPKIVLHGLLRTLTGGRLGRRIIGLAALREAVRDPAAPPPLPAAARPHRAAGAPMASGAAPGGRMLMIATSSRTAEQRRDVAFERFPRVDYVQLGERLHADVLDYAAYPGGRAGSLVRWLETQLRSDPYLALHAAVRQQRYDAVVCMSERVGIPLAALRRTGAYRGRLTVLFHAWSARQELAVTRLGLFRAIDVIGVCSSAMHDLFIRLGAPPERVHVLRWAVDHRFFTPAPRAEGPAFALSLGESRLRNYPLLFEAMHGLPLELHVLAGGYEGAREKRPVRFRAAPPGVSLLPRVSPLELRRLYAQARFVVLPVEDAVYTAGVTAALEAMSMARAVIATRSRGLADYLADGENCLLVPAGDAGALRAAMRRLCDDPALAQRLGENGRRRVEADLNQPRYLDQLAQLLSMNGCRSEAGAPPCERLLPSA
jgi:GT2 family glycosyltransferase